MTINETTYPTHKLIWGHALALALLLILALAATSFAAQKKNEKVSHLSLAALMIKDGHLERAEAVLANVDVADGDIDLIRYYTLSGLVSLQLQKYLQAITAFEQALESGQKAPVINIYLAQAHYHQGDYAATIKALDDAGGIGRSDAQLFLMRSQAHWKLQQREQAWQALSDGEAVFPEESLFLRRKVFMLVELELYLAAVEAGKAYLQQADPTLEDYLAIGRALRKSRRFDEAIFFFEAAMLKFQNNRNALLECAHAYLDLDMKHVAAELFERAAAFDPKLAVEAAEVHRRAKQHQRALFWNSQVDDQQRKIKQRLAILIDQEEFAKVAAMGDSVYRVNLEEDSHVSYALAYSHFRTGDFEEAEDYLGNVVSTEMFGKAVQLRKAMAECREAKWQCY